MHRRTLIFVAPTGAGCVTKEPLPHADFPLDENVPADATKLPALSTKFAPTTDCHALVVLSLMYPLTVYVTAAVTGLVDVTAHSDHPLPG